MRRRVEGPVVTAVVRFANDTQLDDLRRQGNLRVSVFPMGLEEIFVELFGPESRGEMGDRQL